MRAPCEVMSRRFLPRVKSLLVSILYREYHLTQLQISKLLGVSQSSVSRYLNEQRGIWSRLDDPRLIDWLRSAAQKLISGEIDKDALLCEACRFIRASRPDLLRVAA